MTKEMYLNLKGNDGRIIQNSLWTGEEPSEKLAVFLPGFRYPAESPLFHFCKLHLLTGGWSILTVDYRYNEMPHFLSLIDEKQDEYFFKEIKIIQKQLEEQLSYKEYCFVAKSLGTSFLYKMMKNNLAFIQRAPCQFVWLTPGELNREICQMIIEKKHSSLYAIGDNDPYFDRALLEKVKNELGDKCLILPGAGHIFEEKNNVQKTMENTMEVIRFIQGNISKT